MHKRYSLVVAVLLLTVSLFAQAAADAAEAPDRPVDDLEGRVTLQRGAYYLAGYTSAGAFLANARVASTGGGSDAEIGLRSVYLSALGGYFVADRIAVGPVFSLNLSRVSDPADNVDTVMELQLGAQATYFWELDGSPWVPTGRFVVAYERKTEKRDSAVVDRIENGYTISPRIGVSYFFTNRIAGAIEGAYSFSRRTTDEGNATITVNAVGVALGLGFFFR